MNTENMIDITHLDLKEFVKNVYALSRPQGMGFLHFQDGELPQEDVSSILGRGDEQYPVQMDYVRGRSCKMTVFGDEGKRFISDRWYDHSEMDLKRLLEVTAKKEGHAA